MIRYGIHDRTGNGLEGASMFSELNGLNPVDFSNSIMPLEVERISYGDSVEFQNMQTTLLGNSENEFTVTIKLSKKERLKAVLFHFTLGVTAFHANLKCLHSNGTYRIDADTVTAGYEQGATTHPTYCCFSSYNPNRMYFGNNGNVLLMFNGNNNEGDTYFITFSSVQQGTSTDVYVDEIKAYTFDSFVSPIVSFPLQSNASDIASKAGGTYSDNLIFQDSCCSFDSAVSQEAFFKFPSTFLFGLGRSSISFYLHLSPDSSGTIMSKGSGIVLSASNDGTNTSIGIASGSEYSQTFAVSSGWHRVSIAFEASRHKLFIDGQQVMEDGSTYNPFFHNPNSSWGTFPIWCNSELCFGASYSYSSGLTVPISKMKIKRLCFYDHPLDEYDILREMTVWK